MRLLQIARQMQRVRIYGFYVQRIVLCAGNRPVLVLTALSKVFEKVMYDHLYNTFCRYLSQNLSEFLKNYSRCTALLKMTEDWRRSFNNRVSHGRGR